MIIHFYLRFSTTFGQNIFVTGNAAFLGNDEPGNAVALSYLNNEFWYAKIHVDNEKLPDQINYKYILRDEVNPDKPDADKDKSVIIKNYLSKEIILIDTWNAERNIENVFYTNPFKNVFFSKELPTLKIKLSKVLTHEFRVKAPLLNANEIVCLTGSGKMFREWDVKKLLPLTPEKNWFTIKINLSKENFPVEYKYGIYNTKNKSFIYEDGANRSLENLPTKKEIFILHDGLVHSQKRWKGAGVAIPVFSLRSRNSFGTGEFNDIKLLVDWSNHCGIKLLQFLPINDTTSTHTLNDSYPYSAISAFALHPLYINLESVAGKHFSYIIKPLNKNKNSLNLLTDVDYNSVINFKISALKELYEAQKEVFLKDTSYLKFFENNRKWLIPYAAFCFLRDKYQTTDFSKWKSHKIFKKEAIQKLVSPSQPDYNEICFHYFVQYHLHLQLKDASDYAHKNGVALKGDIPIGVSKNSCDVWVDPALYNTAEQSGAPPDDFAVTGQNWGFPLYNWSKMKRDDFKWWRDRFAQMNNYFDAFRIDHILGFFRIWSIPKHGVEGVLGRFVPAIPVHINEFYQNNIWFDYARYCKPFINENILQQFANTAYIKENFLNKIPDDFYEIKQEFNTQKKVEEFFKNGNLENTKIIKQALFDLISNVIMIKENDNEFHFRIAMHNTSSFQNLDPYTQKQLSDLYINYFFVRQNDLWKKEALQKLFPLKHSTNMLICGEDLGMVPDCVPEVMKETGILTLEVQRMPKEKNTDFFHPKNAAYLSVVTPSTHDMSTIREWWQEDKQNIQKFYNYEMGHYGEAPENCEAWITKEIILQHLYSPSMWSIFQIQDLLGMSEKLRRENFYEERINRPADPNHYWKYRMHITLEDLIKQKGFYKEIKTYIRESGRE